MRRAGPSGDSFSLFLMQITDEQKKLETFFTRGGERQSYIAKRRNRGRPEKRDKSRSDGGGCENSHFLLYSTTHALQGIQNISKRSLKLL